MTTSEPTTTSSRSENDGDTIYKLLFYVPQTHTQACLDAVWATGAGTWPNGPGHEPGALPKYTDTCFVSTGTGQFKPAAHADPNIGKPGVVEYVVEDRVEMVVIGKGTVRWAVDELRRAHPYEVVAYFVIKCDSF
ncbi:structural toxin protein RtxA [Exophiala viscosa]|uniref:ATP phosphoribosyltransferase n=1 Tax=Exophiala viscosa TaxID=2486360 RepID=A0AAN6DVN3_9EURO|nr:structural toxin protein RtxA [Exophiala viscosa]